MLSKNRVLLCPAATVIGILLTALIPATGMAQERREWNPEELGKACKSNNGTWVESYWECEYTDRQWCAASGGRFDECGSACRHSPDPVTACTLQCVPICVFSEKETKLETESPVDCTYLIEGEPVTLKNGNAEQSQSSGSSTTLRTRIFDDDAKGNLAGDGTDDVAVLLLHDSGESSSFSYVAAALKTNHGYKGTNAILIGNHLASQKAEISGHTIIVNYADRYPWQSLAVRPSVSRSRLFFVENGELKEKPFAKLSSDTAMKLAMKDWKGCRRSSSGSLTVNVMDGQGGTWYVEALCDALYDPSLSAERKIAQARYKDGVWSLGDILLHQYRCHPNHGREDFSTAKCQ